MSAPTSHPQSLLDLWKPTDDDKTRSLFLLINDGSIGGGDAVTLGIRIKTDSDGSFANFIADPLIVDPFGNADRSVIRLPTTNKTTKAMQKYLTWPPDSTRRPRLEKLAGTVDGTEKFVLTDTLIFDTAHPIHIATVGLNSPWAFLASDCSTELHVTSENWPFEKLYIVPCLQTEMSDAHFVPDYLIYGKVRADSLTSNPTLISELYQVLIDHYQAPVSTAVGLRDREDSDISYGKLKQVMDDNQLILSDLLGDWAKFVEACDKYKVDQEGKSEGPATSQGHLAIEVRLVDTDSIGLINA